MADISAARHAFAFDPMVGMNEGLDEYVTWAREELERLPCAC